VGAITAILEWKWWRIFEKLSTHDSMTQRANCSLSDTYLCSGGMPFPVQWPSEEAADFVWSWDQVKNPVPLTPMARHFMERKRAGMARASEQIGRPSPSERVHANGFVFARSLPVSNELAARSIGIAAADEERRINHLLELWHSEYLPKVEELIDQLKSWSTVDESLTYMVDRFSEVDAIGERLGELHNIAMTLPGVTMRQFQAFCRDEFGDDGEQISIDTVAGMPNMSVELGIAFWDLAQCIPKTMTDDELIASNYLRKFLSDWGQRNESFFEIAYPTWLEDPSFVLTTIRNYADTSEDHSPAVMQERVAAHRIQRTDEARSGLSSKAKVQRFDELLRRAQHNTILMEDHQFHIDQRAHTSLRIPSLAIGDALAAQGTIELRDDVFYLHPHEVKLAADASDTQYQDLVAKRRAERERWTGVIPPRLIGGDSPSGTSESAQPDVIHGNAASAGVATGTARVILTLEDAHRLQPSDILVTYATAPPWTPLFAIAAAIVTDAGGVLSHCAIAAREYGIPAVIGAPGATGAIPDGAMVEVDGSKGIVSIIG
jgi:phosphohistidine swiveling domain-containing protein